MHYKKISAYIFIIGALIAILGSAFPTRAGMQGIDYILLITIGVILGLMNKDDKDEVPFLVSSAVFIIASLTLIPILSRYPLLSTVGAILFNLIILIAPLAIVTSIKLIVGFASQTENERFAHETKIPHAGISSRFEQIWSHVIVVSVAIVFILIVLHLLFDVSPYEPLIAVLDYIVIAIFAIDLIRLYKKSKDIHYFFHNYWLDIVAVLPFGILFRFAKILRAAEILRSFSSSAYLAEGFSMAGRSVKFFSSEPALSLTRRAVSKSFAVGKRKKRKKRK